MKISSVAWKDLPADPDLNQIYLVKTKAGGIFTGPLYLSANERGGKAFIHPRLLWSYSGDDLQEIYKIED